MKAGIAIPGVLAVVFSITGAAAARAEVEDSLARGERVFKSLCWTCHGRYGRGDGPAAGDLRITPPDFTDARLLAQRSDQEVLGRITGADQSAHTPMSVGAVLQPEALADALAYIRTLSVPGKHVSLPAGRDIYNGTCWVCHGPEGDGKGPATKNMEPPPRDFTSPDFVIEGREEEVYRAISMGAAEAFHGSAYMPEWGTRLSEQQIRDVMEYLKTFKTPQP